MSEPTLKAPLGAFRDAAAKLGAVQGRSDEERVRAFVQGCFPERAVRLRPLRDGGFRVEVVSAFTARVDGDTVVLTDPR